jgi:hypothetical protein
MKEEEIIEQAKKFLRARAGTIELKEHLIEILSEKFNNPEEVIKLLIERGLAKDVGGGWIDLITLFRGIYVGYSKEEEEE